MAFAALVAVEQAGEADIGVETLAVVVVVFTVAGHGLMVAVAVVVEGQQPVAEGRGIMQRQRAAAAAGGVACAVGVAGFVAQIVPVGHIKQIAQAERVVGGKGEVALIFAGGFAARIIGAQREAVRQKLLLPQHHHIACARRFARLDADIGFGRGQALEVFQTLLERTQIEDLAV